MMMMIEAREFGGGENVVDHPCQLICISDCHIYPMYIDIVVAMTE